MAIRKILYDGDDTLIKKSRVVDKFDKRLHILLDDLRDTLIEADGMGLAAPQVGVLRRVFIIASEDGFMEFINPEIVYTEGEVVDIEGCLSVPNVYGLVPRPKKVTMKTFDRNGNCFELDAEDMLARAFCHETDHLDGKLYIPLVERFLTDEELLELRNNKQELQDGEQA